MALLPLLVALSAPAAAQQVESMLPVMDDLGTLITKLEGDGFQITGSGKIVDFIRTRNNTLGFSNGNGVHISFCARGN